MAERKSTRASNPNKPKPETTNRRKVGGGKEDELGVVRGQNAEKTGPTRKEQIRDEGIVSH